MDVMEFKKNITRRINLIENQGLSSYKNYTAQQHHDAYEIFYKFLTQLKPKKILEIGTALGGFISFIKESCDNLGLSTVIRTYDVIEYPDYKKMIENGIDVRIENIFNSDYSEVNKDVIDFISSDGVTLVLCDGGNKSGEFNILSNFLKKGDIIMGHDYAPNEIEFQNNYNLKIWNWHELSDNSIQEPCKRNNLKSVSPNIFNQIVWVCKVKDEIVGTPIELSFEDKNDSFSTLENNEKEKISEDHSSEITLVTGLWDIKRDSLSDGWSRSFDHYLAKFKELLKSPYNMIIFGDSNIENIIWEHRTKKNTIFIKRSTDWFVNTVPYNKIQEIRKDPDWYNQTGWLADSTQAKLDMYNPLVMSKMFLLHDAKIFDSFDSSYLFWIDAGLANTVHPGYFYHDRVLDKLPKYITKFSFVCFPYEAEQEIHGFEAKSLYSIAGKKVNKVARGGFFGGPKETISDINSIYYGLLLSTLNSGLMGTEESIFSIMCYKHSDLINYFEIESNGLFGKFFEDLKNDNLIIKSESSLSESNNFNIKKTSLYVISFNSPNQFRTLIDSMVLYDKNFIKEPKKYLLDNSTDLHTFDEYSSICTEFGFEHIKKDNLGICGGRQFIAEHFDQSDSDFMFFFEDDMFFYPNEGVCRNGFNRFVKDLYNTSLEIAKKENFDFLKLNYSEFFGDNGTQWAWYNVPQTVREKNWPNKCDLPIQGLDPNAPKAKYDKIVSYKGVPYTSGEVYYCNWPQIVNKTGNKKMFIDTKWAYPYEQTWMSHMYQLTIKGELNFGLLLMTPTEHNRFDFYKKELRKEC